MATARVQIHLRGSFTLLFPLQTTTGDGEQFRVSGEPFEVDVRVRPDTPAGAGFFSENAPCEAIAETSVSESTVAEIRRWPQIQADWGAGVRSTKAGSAPLASPFLQLSPSAQDAAGAITGRLTASARLVASMICWVSDYPVPVSPLSVRRYEWSDNGVDWSQLPSRIYVRLGHIGLPWLTPDSTVTVQEVLSSGTAEPLAFGLASEAISARDKSPRSAYVMLVAALEVGVKRALAVLVPQAEWLLTNSPTPPIVQILDLYLPTLRPREGFDVWPGALPRDLSNELKKIVGLRNDLVHKGDARISEETWETSISVVGDLLHALDYCIGNGWARDQIESEMVSRWLA